jgi:hypothetical protein
MLFVFFTEGINMWPGIIPIAIVGILAGTAITIVGIVSWSRATQAKFRAQGMEYGANAHAQKQREQSLRGHEYLRRARVRHNMRLRRYEERLLRRNYGAASRLASIGAASRAASIGAASRAASIGAASRAANIGAVKAKEAAGRSASGDSTARAAQPEDIIRLSRLRISRLESIADNLADAGLAARVKRVCGTAGLIVQKASRKPELIRDIRFFLDYYLPVLAKIIENFDSLGVDQLSGVGVGAAPGSYAAETALSVHSLVANVEVAFQKQLDALANDSLIDIEAEIRVFQRTLREDGFITEEEERHANAGLLKSVDSYGSVSLDDEANIEMDEDEDYIDGQYGEMDGEMIGETDGEMIGETDGEMDEELIVGAGLQGGGYDEPNKRRARRRA